MAGVRRALLMNAGERYAALAVNFVTLLTVSRLMTPAEIGVAAIGAGAMTLILALRQFGSPEALIQRPEATRAEIRAATTLQILLGCAIALGLAGAAPVLAGFYGEPALAPYLRLVAVAALADAGALSLVALMRREMAFGALAAINLASLAAGAATTIGLAASGAGPVSFAWGGLVSSAALTIGALVARPLWWSFAPSLSAARAILSFGVYHGATVVLDRLYEALPQLALGRVLEPRAVAYYNRSSVIVGLPDRLILSIVFQIAFPAFANELRLGRDIAGAYLAALGYIAGLHWPGLILLALVAEPVVGLLLGAQWDGVAAIVQVMALACLFYAPTILGTPVLLAGGAFRANLAARALSVGVCGAVLVAASPFGVMAMALTQFFTIPFQAGVSLVFVRRRFPFAWRAVAAALAPSLAAAACGAAAGLAARLALAGGDAPSLADALGIAAALALGWLAGLVAARHPLAGELARLVAHLAGLVAAPLRPRRTGAALEDQSAGAPGE